MPKRSSKTDYSLSPEGLANTIMWFWRWLICPMNVILWAAFGLALLAGARLTVGLVLNLLPVVVPLLILPSIAKAVRNGGW
jgi:hypothetical protein